MCDLPELCLDPPEMAGYWAWRSFRNEEAEYDKAEIEISLMRMCENEQIDDL